MHKLETVEQFNTLIHENRTLFLFKRSTRCPTSFMAFEEFRRFAEEHPDTPCAYLNVIEERDLSNHVASITAVEHASPQVLLFNEGRVVWHDSHSGITQEVLQRHCKEA